MVICLGWRGRFIISRPASKMSLLFVTIAAQHTALGSNKKLAARVITNRLPPALSCFKPRHSQIIRHLITLNEGVNVITHSRLLLFVARALTQIC